MEGIDIKYKDAVRALETLESALKEPFSTIVRDASIQRFEYTFEAFWKFLKNYLKEREGVIANSPKSCFKEIFSLGFLNEEQTVLCLEMTDKRNDTSHTYKEKLAQAIYDKLKEYAPLMKNILFKFQDKIKQQHLF